MLKKKEVSQKLYQFLLTPSPIIQGIQIGIMNVSAYAAEDAYAYVQPKLEGRSAMLIGCQDLEQFLVDIGVGGNILEVKSGESLPDYSKKTDAEIKRIIKYLETDLNYKVTKRKKYGKIPKAKNTKTK